MERHSLDRLASALNRANVRFLIAGGLAVVAHGYLRYTSDVDMILEPGTPARLRAVEALAALGYRPRVPVDFADFAVEEKRAAWAREKGMMVFSLTSPHHGRTVVDLFLESPFEFDSVYARAHRERTDGGVELTFVPLDVLLEMKRRAGRHNDLDDIEKLEAVRKDRERS